MTTPKRLIDHFAPDHYSLSLTIDRPKRMFDGSVTIDGAAVTDGSIWLHAKDLEVTSSMVNGKPVNVTTDENDGLELHANVVSGENITIALEFKGTISDQMHGMYPCYFEHNGVKKELIATQFESHHAREVFPCIDEPAAKATFDINLTTEQGITVLGNMPVLTQRKEQDKLVTTFERTPRMSSYLVAWVYGDMQKKTARTKRDIEVNVWATTAQPAESLDFAVDFAVKTIDYFEEYFGVEYPLPKSDHVALPDFSSGAMENWGLITYREVALLADPATSTVDAKHYVAMVVAHELSHQWFGNLVTMEWWDNLWLNESFANFIENLPIHAMHSDWGIWMDYASSWSLMAMRRDAIEGVQPVQLEVNHPDEISSLFDGAIVYGKGGRLIGMLREFVGEDDFKKGLKTYFTKFQYKNTRGEDLWDCLEAASGKPVRDFMNKWVLRPGYPVVHVRSDGLEQEQFFIGDHKATDTLWPIPLGASAESTLPAVLDEKNLKVPIPLGTRLNIGNWSHFVTDYDDAHFSYLLERMQSYAPLDRLQLINERVLLTRSGHVSNVSLIELVQQNDAEANESVWGILSLGFSELKKFVEFDDAARNKLKLLACRISQTQYERLGWQGPADENENDVKLRPSILALKLFCEDSEVLEEAVKRYDQSSGSIESLDPELRSIILAGRVKHEFTDEIFEQLLTSYKTSVSSTIRDDISGALTGVEDDQHIERVLSLMSDPEIVRPQDAAHWFVYLIRNRHAKAKTWQWLQDNWDGWVVKTFGGDKSYDDFPRYTAGALSTRKQLDEYISFFSEKKSEPALTRVIELGIAEIRARVDLIESQKDDVIKALLKLED
jgi:aminopeptidase N